jgi:cell division protease FtsH
LPDVNGREKILKVHVRNVPMAAECAISRCMARGTPGFSGADLDEPGQ